LSNQPPPDDRPEPPRSADPAAPPPVTPDGTSAPVSGQPWSTPSGDFPTPEAYQPGYAAPPTAQFPVTPPPIDYAPPGSGTPDYGYAQPGYPPPGYAQPGYPPPGYAQPGYPPPPPPPPPRKSNTPLIAVILAVALLLCGGVATAGVLITRAATQKARDVVEPFTEPTLPTGLPELPTDLPTAPGGRQLSVTYEVTGDSPAQIYYLAELGQAPTQLQSVSLPWKVTRTIPTPALVSVTAVRLTGAAGTISCRTLVDGKEVAKKTNYSTYGSVSCNWFVLD
jgi:MmpS family membrane protein